MDFLSTTLIIAPPFLLSVILHEVAHGATAEFFGDPTARESGRITLNPVKHIDPVMSILLPLGLILMGSPIVFGGAKPVPVNPYYFRNPRKNMAYVAMAGPAVNLLLAAFCFLAYSLLPPHFMGASLVGVLLASWLLYGIIINLVLAIFNLLPVPPLDGGRIAVGFLPLPLARSFARLEPFGILIVVALLYTGFIHTIFEPVLRLAARALGSP